MPEPLHFDCLSRLGDIADSVEARSVPADVDGVHALDKGMTILIDSAYFYADRLAKTGFTAVDSPKIRYRRPKGNACLGGSSPILTDIGDPAFLLPVR